MIRLSASLLRHLQTGGLPALHSSLQTALRVEHATIPPYLYTLYSLGTDPGNATVAQVIKSVVIEEMEHMTIVANIINAVGGRPVIASPDFLISYPGPLPGSVESGLQVTLAPFSTQHVESVFMEIETPENPEDFPVAGGNGPDSKPDGVTIGQFYRGLQDSIRALGPGIFTGNPALQVTNPFGESVTDLDSAIDAIDLIIDQGEGSSDTDPLAGIASGNELSHYYRFASIVAGKELIADPSAPGGFSYSGPPYVASGPIATLAPNPKAANYAPGTAERHAMDNFNYTYTSLLKGLEALFNGQPETFLRTLGTMSSLREQALDMMAGTNLHQAIGPSFEYLPVLPA